MLQIREHDLDRHQAATVAINLARADLDYHRTVAQFMKGDKFIGSDADEALMLSVLLLRVLEPEIALPLDQCALNVAYGLLTGEEAIAALAKFLRRQQFGGSNGRSNLVASYHCLGSHIELRLYNGVVFKPTVRRAAEVLLGTVPTYAAPCHEFANVVRAMRTRLKEVSSSSFTTDGMRARLVLEATLLKQAGYRVLQAARKKTAR